MTITQKNLPVRKQGAQQLPATTDASPRHCQARGTRARLGQTPPPQNTSRGRLPAYSRLRDTNLISFQTGNLWLRGRHLFLGMASASSRWKSNRLRPPAITAASTAQLPTQVPSKLWPAQLTHRLFTMQHYNYVFHPAGPLSHRLFWTMCRGFALFFLSLPTQKQAGSLFQTTSSPCSAPSSTDCLISSESATSDQPQLAWTWAKDFSLQFCCTTWSK